jgi:hypothetical protein
MHIHAKCMPENMQTHMQAHNHASMHICMHMHTHTHTHMHTRAHTHTHMYACMRTHTSTHTHTHEHEGTCLSDSRANTILQNAGVICLSAKLLAQLDCRCDILELLLVLGAAPFQDEGIQSADKIVIRIPQAMS